MSYREPNGTPTVEEPAPKPNRVILYKDREWEVLPHKTGRYRCVFCGTQRWFSHIGTWVEFAKGKGTSPNDGALLRSCNTCSGSWFVEGINR